MRVTGTRGSVEFDLENGYVATAKGELLTGGKFWVWTSTMEWLPPHEDEEITPRQVRKIIREVQRTTNENTMELIFD